MGWKPGEDVWRLEFEFKRESLKDRGLTSLDDVLDNLNGLWNYAAMEWLRLTVPNETDSTRARWPMHELWSTLASVDWSSEQGVLLDKCTTARNPTELRLITVVLGAMTSYMALHGHRRRCRLTAILVRIVQIFGFFGVSVVGLPSSSRFVFGMMAGEPAPGASSTLSSTIFRHSSTSSVECLDGSMWAVFSLVMVFPSGLGADR